MPHTQPGHPYLEPKNHASKGIHPQDHMGGEGVAPYLSNKHMNDVGHKSMKLGGGGRFAALKGKIMAQGKSAASAEAIAAAAGRAKYGSKRMAKWSAAGRKRG